MTFLVILVSSGRHEWNEFGQDTDKTKIGPISQLNRMTIQWILTVMAPMWLELPQETETVSDNTWTETSAADKV